MNARSLADSFAHAQSMIPPDTAAKSVFPYDRELDVFDRNTLYFKKPNGISQNDANRVLADLESIKRDKMSGNYTLPIIVLVVVSLILIVLCIVMIFTEDTAYYLGWIMVGVFVVGLAALCFLTYRSYMAHEKRMD